MLRCPECDSDDVYVETVDDLAECLECGAWWPLDDPEAERRLDLRLEEGPAW